MSKIPGVKLQLRAILPQALQINKPLILVISAIIAFIIGFGLVTAFNSSPKANVRELNDEMGGGAKMVVPAKATGISNEFDASLQNLPQNYHDIEAIKKYAPDMTGNNKVLADLQKELEILKNEGMALQQEVTKLNQHPRDSVLRSNDQQSMQAKNSGMFFGGIAPTPSENSGLKSNDNSGNNGTTALPASGGRTNDNTILVSNVTDVQMQKLSPAAQTAFYSDQNMQVQKLAVLKAADNPEDIYDLHNVAQPASPYEIQAGSLIPTVLITGINTTLEGTAVAQTRFDVYDTVTGKYLLLPKGSRIVGEYSAKISAGQRRVLLTFNRIIRPDGSSILIGKPMAADMQGQAGVEGKVDNHWSKLLAAATLSTILSVGAGVASDNSGNDSTYYRSSKQNAILGAASNISQIGASMANRAMDIQPTITLNPGFQFNIIVRRDMVLTPFVGTTLGSE